MNKNLVILHGWQGRIEKWVTFRKMMADSGWQVWLPSLPGFGAITLTRPWELGDYVDWLKSYLSQQQIKSFFLLGHSFGGRIALKYAALKPNLLQSLILVDSAGIKPGKRWKKSTLFLLTKTAKALFLLPPLSLLKKPITWLWYTLIGEKDYYQANKVMKKTLQKIINEDLRPILSQVACPTLIVWGAKDKLTPVADAYLMADKISQAKLVVFPAIGHSLPFEETSRLVKEINQFIKNDTN